MTVLQISHDLSRHCLDLTAEAQGHVQSNKEKDSPTFTKTTQLLVVHAKLKTTLAGLHSRVSDLNKRRSNPALNILLSVLDYT
ncbi:unnamed protein product [Heligmosomoides polygyrus]|uniref:Uncharacterized protein n=1 Tax=Heligmosomoides polygyrus TaxID=6339 RepID=A0A183F8N4_HELPZ|nr:unnamed protein product [Heligmosomoides polygyrus]